jgi:two-component system response regulator RegA
MVASAVRKGSPDGWQRFLVVEDCPSLRTSLVTLLVQRGEVREAASVCEAVALLRSFTPELVLLDVVLPDGSALDVLRALETIHPAPAVIAMSGSATPAATFQLAALAVAAYLPKPITPAALDRTIDRIRSGAPSLVPHVRAVVGKRSLTEVESEVRATMVREALAKAGGSRRRAAELLSISRQLLQYVLRTATRV